MTWDDMFGVIQESIREDIRQGRIPKPGGDFRTDVQVLAMSACFVRYGYAIEVLDDWELNAIHLAVIDAWTNWPEENGEAVEAACETVLSLAVAGGWEECLLWNTFDDDDEDDDDEDDDDED